MTEAPRFQLPMAMVFRGPTRNQLDVEQAHLDGRLIYDAVDAPRVRMRIDQDAALAEGE